MGKGQTLFPREYTWPLPADFEWPEVSFIAFYEHSGAFRDAWPEPAFSVADRPTASPPPEGKYHFCMDVHLFLSVYPYPVNTCTAGVTCTYSTWANHSRWPEFVLSGRILGKAEEFLFMMYIGARAAGEHPPSCLEAIIGLPSFITTYFEHGPADDSHSTHEKTVEWFTRNLSVVRPSHIVPEHLRTPRPSHSNSDVSMIVRSTMPFPFASAHAAVWAAEVRPAPDAGRPAWQVAPGYLEHRALMHSNYAAFAAQYTPTISAAALAAEDRSPLLIAVPIGMSDVCCALIPMRHACFGKPLQEGIPLLEQMHSLARFLPQHEQPQLMHITRGAHGDVVFAIPFVERIRGAVASLAEAPARRNLKAVWVTRDALSGPQFEHTILAMQRRQSFVGPVPWMLARVGVTNGPVPVTPHRASARYKNADGLQAALEWEAFLEDERLYFAETYSAFEAEDGGTGILAPFMANIHTAFTRRHELQPPDQGLPDLDPAHYSMMPYPDAPMPLHTSYLAKNPPQQLPNGFPESLSWDEVLHRWHRRMLAQAVQMNAEHDFECYEQGWSDLPRHPFLCVGAGGFRTFRFVDGTGEIPLNAFLLRVGTDGRLRPMDFEYPDHKDRAVIIGQMGFSTDKELLSFLMHGARWKVPWPRQMRISHSVWSLKTRAKAVGEATAKLIEAGLYIAEKLIVRGEKLSEDTPVTAMSPQYSTGMGGADKTDKPWEARPCGNTSDPHDVAFERNAPHGPADGARALSVNDMTGLKHYPPGFEGYVPFPDPETKSTNREVYAAECVIGAMAAINGTKPGMSKDDVRWMFFQLNTEPCEFWIQVQYLIIATCIACLKFEVSCKCKGRIVLVLYKVIPRVTNMGTRPASKIAVRFSKQINVEWRARMADYVQAVWLPRQTQALRNLLADREERLGYAQAHPFCTFEFTDDFLDVTPCTKLTAVGARVRREMAREMNLWMSAKAEAGSCVDYIGGRHLITGGFGTLAPHKRARCVEQCSAALLGLLDLDEFSAHNSFLVHVRDILDFDVHLMEGNWLPMRVLTFGWVKVDLEDPRFARIRQNYERIRSEVATRPAASFATGFFDAPRDAATSPGDKPVLYLHMASDCRADGVTTCIFGALMEYEWRICLSDMDPRWARRHINVGESTGAAVNVAVFGVPFGMFELIQGGDNRAEGPMLLGKSKASDQRVVGNAMRDTAGYKACCEHLWFEHNSGDGLGFTDAGSRDLHSVLDNLAAAYGRRGTRIDPLRVPGVLELLSIVLENTTDYVKPTRDYVKPKRISFEGHSAADLRKRPREEFGDGVCPSADRQNSASQVRSLSPTPPRDRPPQPRHREAAAVEGATLTPSPVRACASFRTSPPSRTNRELSPTPPRVTSVAAPRRLARTSPTARELHGTTPRDESPQPLTAAAARAAAALESTETLLGSTSSSIPNASKQELRALCTAAHYCEVKGIPRGTKGNDEWGFKWVRRFGERFGLRWMRPRVVPPHLQHLEDRFAALALFYIVPAMKPAPRTLAKGIDQAKPPSGMEALYGWRRVMRDCDRHVPDLKAAGRVLRGMIEQLKARCGQDVMSVDHHIPYPLQSICKAVAYLESYSNKKWTVAFTDSVRVAMLFSLARGPRLDEWCEMFHGDTFYRRANFAWCRGDALVGSTAAADVAGLVATIIGWILRATNVPSKTDRTGGRWIGKHMWYRPNDNPLNFASAWARYERKYPCLESDRRAWAAFSPTGGAEAFKPTRARTALHEVWLVLEGEVFAKQHSWHDFRATIATALTAAGKSPAFTQAAVCWASPASVALYGQLTPGAMAEAADIATTLDASRHAHVEVPHVSEGTVIEELEACEERMTTEANAANKAAADKKKKEYLHSRAAPSKATSQKAKAPARPPKKRAAVRHPKARPPGQESPSSRALVHRGAEKRTLASTTGTPASYAVGLPLRTVRVSTPHSLDGTRVEVANDVWGAGPGATWCTLRGFAADVRLDDKVGVCVITADDDGKHYAFTVSTIAPYLDTPARGVIENMTKSCTRKRAAAPRTPTASRARRPKATASPLPSRRSPRLVAAADCAATSPRRIR